MPRTALDLANGFVSHLRHLDSIRTKMERLQGSGQIVRHDIEQIYLGLYIEAVTSLERTIEQLFIALLTRRVVHSSRSIVPRIPPTSPQVARKIVLGGQSYVDWLPYRHTEKRAEAFFRNGLPFSNLNLTEKKQLEQIMYIRNAIAHKSVHSLRTYETKVLSSLSLRPRERTPAGFLRSIFRVAPAQTRYEYFATEMASIARRLC